jgi:predicted regulator of Ras-like GTPase activity (Roadblock/LC7/MglB family)
MARLAQEVGAEAVLLIRDGALLSQAGRIQKQQADGLAAAVNESWQASARVAQSMGKEPRFEQSIEGADYLLYTLTLAENLILSVIVQGKVPLGMIRHQTKEAAETIRGLMGA